MCCNDSTLLGKIKEEGFYQLYKDNPQTSVSIETKKWGLYESVEVRATDGHFSSIRLLGKAQKCVYEAALWVCSRDMPLSIGGKWEVKESTYIPTSGIKYATLGILPFQGKEIKDYYIGLSERELPEVDRSNLYLMDKYLKQTEVLPSSDDGRYKAYILLKITNWR